jgi:hypothetical protein
LPGKDYGEPEEDGEDGEGMKGHVLLKVGYFKTFSLEPMPN